MSSLPRQRGVTEFQPKGGCLSLTLTDLGQTISPKCNPYWLPNEILGFAWQGSYYSIHNGAKFSDWLICHNRKCCKGTFKAPCLVALRMLLQLTYCCLHNQCEY